MSVFFHKPTKKYYVRLNRDNVMYSFGYWPSKEEAEHIENEAKKFLVGGRTPEEVIQFKRDIGLTRITQIEQIRPVRRIQVAEMQMR